MSAFRWVFSNQLLSRDSKQGLLPKKETPQNPPNERWQPCLLDITYTLVPAFFQRYACASAPLFLSTYSNETYVPTHLKSKSFQLSPQSHPLPCKLLSLLSSLCPAFCCSLNPQTPSPRPLSCTGPHLGQYHTGPWSFSFLCSPDLLLHSEGLSLNVVVLTLLPRLIPVFIGC